jgi:hypothetical protein
VATPSEPTKLIPSDPKERAKLLERAQRGDETTLPAIREMLKLPHMVEACGNMAAHAENSLIRKLAGKDVAIREGVHQKMESLRAELSGPSPAPLERLLAERIVACWLHLYLLELNYAGKENMSLELGAYYQRSISAAHKRYLSAMKTLAVVRKLALPALQVNIARKQVNVAAAITADMVK